MNRTLLVVPALLLLATPAFSQSGSGGGDRDSSYSGMGRDVDEMLRAIGESGRGGGFRRGGGAAFFMRSGDNIVAVRCDPQDSMKSCVDSTLTLLERAKSAQPSTSAPGGGATGQPQAH